MLSTINFNYHQPSFKGSYTASFIHKDENGQSFERVKTPKKDWCYMGDAEFIKFYRDKLNENLLDPDISIGYEIDESPEGYFYPVLAIEDKNPRSLYENSIYKYEFPSQFRQPEEYEPESLKYKIHQKDLDRLLPIDYFKNNTMNPFTQLLKQRVAQTGEKLPDFITDTQ